MYDGIIEAIEKVGSFISSIGTFIKNILYSITDFFVAIYDILVEVSSFIISALGFVWYAGKTLIIGVFKLIISIFDGGVFVNVNRAFIQISDYIGGPATIFIASLLFIIVVRIIIAFVFKIMKLNIDYNSFDKNSRKANSWANASEYRKKSITRF